jgi:hypothetical protein
MMAIASGCCISELMAIHGVWSPCVVLDLQRLVWLESKVAAGQGRVEDAIGGLEQVRREFTV